MSAQGGFAELDERIAGVRDSLTPIERRLAVLVSDEPIAVAFGTVAELAERIGTSGATIVRFASKLGFDGYAGLQANVRQTVSDRLSLPKERIRREPQTDAWSAARGAAMSALEDTFDHMDADRIRSLSAPVAGAGGHVWIVASETSSPVAHVLAANLRLVRPGVRHLAGSAATMATAIVDAGSNDVVIAIDFERYERVVVDTARRLGERGADVVAITDGPLSPLASLASQWCAVTVPAVGPFDSALPALAVVEAVTADVATLLRAAATARLDRIEDSWSESAVFESTPE